MSIASLLADLAAEARHSAVMIGEPGHYSYDVCVRKATLQRLAAEGFAQAATLETESAKMAARYRDNAARYAADANFWSRHADLMLEREASAFEPA
jgi:hypothetical protein